MCILGGSAQLNPPIAFCLISLIFMQRLFLFAVAISLFVGCTSEKESDQGANKINVVTTTSMIADLARQIGGEHVHVEGLMGPGVDPHLYKASEGDVSRMTNADVVFYNGLHLEGKMVEIFEQMSQRGLSVVQVTDVIAKESLLESALFAGNYDPHVWFDVQLWKVVAISVEQALTQARPDLEGDFISSRRRVQAELDSLHMWAGQQLSSIPPKFRTLITSHDAFGYFGRAYGLEVRGLQGISTASEAGTADVQQLAEYVAENQIPAMFIESSISPRGIEAVREAVRSRDFDVAIGGTLYGDALGSPESGADTYVGMVRSNVNTIVAGLTPDN